MPGRINMPGRRNRLQPIVQDPRMLRANKGGPVKAETEDQRTK